MLCEGRELLINQGLAVDDDGQDGLLMVVEDLPRDALKVAEGGDVAPLKRCSLLVEVGTEKLLATPAENEAEDLNAGLLAGDLDLLG